MVESGVVTLLCFALHFAVTSSPLARQLRAPIVFVHFALGIAVFLTYLIAYVLAPDWFMQTWRSLYFGYYIYDIVVILTYWKRIFAAFRTFYAIHHTVSFLITGVWMYVGGEWLSYIVLGLVLWLGSDLWLYAMSLYRAGPWKQLPRHTLAKLRLRVFWVERVHRLVAYVLPWVLAGFHLSDFALLVLGTGLANDVLDATFQWKSLSKRGAKRRPQPAYARRHALEPSLLPHT